MAELTAILLRANEFREGKSGARRPTAEEISFGYIKA